MLKGSGKIFVNGKVYSQYFKRPIHQLAIEKPLQLQNQRMFLILYVLSKVGV